MISEAEIINKLTLGKKYLGVLFCNQRIKFKKPVIQLINKKLGIIEVAIPYCTLTKSFPRKEKKPRLYSLSLFHIEDINQVATVVNQMFVCKVDYP